jgi:hypothetical protein
MSDLPPAFRDQLGDGDLALAEELHDLVVSAVPEAVVVPGALVSYELPPGRQLAALARRKDGFRLYLTSLYEDPAVLADHGDALRPLMVGKSCLRVRSTGEVPADAVADALRRGAATAGR